MKPAVTIAVIITAAALAGCTGHPAPAPTVTVTISAHPSAAASPSIGAGPLLQPEACQRITYAVDGSAGPVVCPDGHPNAYMMPPLGSEAPHMMSLGEFATTGDVSAAACADLRHAHSTLPIEESAYQFMKALNGWSFAIDPASVATLSLCF
jgi:hypothetical protein